MKFTRREWLLAAGGGILAVNLPGCALARVVVQVGPKVGKIAAALLGVADGILTLNDLYRQLDDPLEVRLDERQIAQLQNNARLVIIDRRGREFTPALGFFDAIGRTQPGFRGEPLQLMEKPDFAARVIRPLKVGEPVGVFDLRHGARSGWYHVEALSTRETVGGPRGWVSGYCLERLPSGR